MAQLAVSVTSASSLYDSIARLVQLAHSAIDLPGQQYPRGASEEVLERVSDLVAIFDRPDFVGRIQEAQLLHEDFAKAVLNEVFADKEIFRYELGVPTQELPRGGMTVSYNNTPLEVTSPDIDLSQEVELKSPSPSTPPAKRMRASTATPVASPLRFSVPEVPAPSAGPSTVVSGPSPQSVPIASLEAIS